jgi:hypothetical protein
MTEFFDNPIPSEFNWAGLSSRSGDELEVHHRPPNEDFKRGPSGGGTAKYIPVCGGLRQGFKPTAGLIL